MIGRQIKHASELKKGMVLEFRHLQYKTETGTFVSKNGPEQFHVVKAIGLAGCSNHHCNIKFYSSHGIAADVPVPTWSEWTTWHVGDMTEAEVDAMLADDCLWGA